MWNMFRLQRRVTYCHTIGTKRSFLAVYPVNPAYISSQVNSFSDSEHEKGHPPLCILICQIMLQRWENIFLRTFQEKSLPSVCIARCLFTLLGWVNFLLHAIQERGLSSVCTARRLHRTLRWTNLLWHTSQENDDHHSVLWDECSS
jgi:hypothetical protein